MERTLFVFEGEKFERLYFQSLERSFFSGEESRILLCFKNDIYELYRELAADKDLDSFEIIRELTPLAKDREELAKLRRDQISQIYLFFDMEPRDNQFNKQKLLEMLAHFNNETEHGKLFISYPMVEAIRDIDDHEEYLTRTVSIDDCIGKRYKPLSADRGNQAYQDARKIDKEAWQGLISVHIKKANGFISGEFSLEPVIDQQQIALAQLSKYMPINEVAVLSAFPIFLMDYFGEKVFRL